jgi:hypothetical protein
MKIIFNRCNAIGFLFRTCFKIHLFICTYLFTLNCRLLDKDGGRLAEEEEGEEEQDDGRGIAGRRCPAAGDPAERRRPAAGGAAGWRRPAAG